jgi:hypothetical protein
LKKEGKRWKESMKAIEAVDEKDSNKVVGVIKSFFGKAFLRKGLC